MKTKKITLLSMLWLSGVISFFAFSETPLNGVIIGTKSYGWNSSEGQWYGKEKAFDGNTSTFFAPDGPYGTDTYMGLAFLAPKTIDSIRYVPRNGNTRYLPYGRFEGANNLDFSDAVTIGTIAAEPPFAMQKVLSTNTTQGFKFVRYFVAGTPNALADLAELQFFGKEVAGSTSLIKLSGIATGAAGWGGDETYGPTKAFDNDFSTLYASAASDGTSYLSYELLGGTLPTLKYVYVFTRNSNPEALQGATLIGSNNADFSSPTTLVQINNVELATGLFLPITTSNKYRYIRLNAPANHFLNLMEFQLYGMADTSTGISILNESNNISIYPNPCSKFVSVSLNSIIDESVEISIYNLQGGVIKSDKYNSKVGQTIFNLNIQNLPAGTYLVKLKTANTIATKNIIVQ